MLLERVPATWLTDVERAGGLRLERFDPATDFDRWERGRIFAAAFELRWEGAEGAFQAVYCGQPVPLPGFEAVQDIDVSTLPAETPGYFLWGSKVKDEDLSVVGRPAGTSVFIELQVPRLLDYPVSPRAQRVKVLVREYRNASGTIVYHRFAGLEEVP